MKLSILARALSAALLACATVGATAANVSLSGDIRYNTDIVQVSFSLAAAGAVKVWTDSWQSGLNFDPVAAVWAKSGNGYTLLSEVDDDDSIGAGQGSFDAGLGFGLLGAGQYLVTLAASPNYARGTTLAAGFGFDGSTPILIADWNQPGYNVNANDQKGTFWRINLQGVTQAALVPEPSAGLMTALGLAALGVAIHRRKS